MYKRTTWGSCDWYIHRSKWKIGYPFHSWQGLHDKFQPNIKSTSHHSPTHDPLACYPHTCLVNKILIREIRYYKWKCVNYIPRSCLGSHLACLEINLSSRTSFGSPIVPRQVTRTLTNPRTFSFFLSAPRTLKLTTGQIFSSLSRVLY